MSSIWYLVKCLEYLKSFFKRLHIYGSFLPLGTIFRPYFRGADCSSVGLKKQAGKVLWVNLPEEPSLSLKHTYFCVFWKNVFLER